MDSSRERVAFWLTAVAVTVAALWLVWSVRYLPTNDGPQALLAVHMERHYDDPGSVYRQLLLPKPQLVARGFSLLYEPLVGWLGWRDALRVVQSLMVLLYGWGGVALCWALDRRRRFVGLLAIPLAFGWHHFMGFFSFEVGTSVGVWLLAFAIARRPLRNLDRVALSVGLLLTFMLHAMCAALGGVAIACLVLTEEKPRWRLELGWLGSTALVLGGLLSLLLVGDSQLEKASNDLTFQPLASTLAQLPHMLAPGPAWRGLLVLAVMVVALASHVRWRRDAPGGERGLFAVAVLFSGVGLAAPLHIPGWQYFGPRMWPLALVSALPLLPLERLSSRRWVGPVAVAALSVASFAAVRSLERQLVTGCSDALSGLDQPIRRQGVVMPFQLEIYCGVQEDPDASQVPHLEALVHMAALYAVAHGGFVPYLFVGTGAVHAFTFRDHPLPLSLPPRQYFAVGSDLSLRSDLVRRRALLTELAANGSQVEAIVAFGVTDDDKRYLKERGYVADFEQGTLLLAHFERCELELFVEPSMGHHRVDVGFGVPRSPALTSWKLALKPDEELHVGLPTLCGELWVEARFEDGSRCAGADEQGRLAVSVSREPSSLRCTPSPR